MPSHNHPVRIWQIAAPNTYIAHGGNGINESLPKSTEYTGGGAAHNHGATGATDNTPVFMSCFYIIKAI